MKADIKSFNEKLLNLDFFIACIPQDTISKLGNIVTFDSPVTLGSVKISDGLNIAIWLPDYNVDVIGFFKTLIISNIANRLFDTLKIEGLIVGGNYILTPDETLLNLTDYKYVDGNIFLFISINCSEKGGLSMSKEQREELHTTITESSNIILRDAFLASQDARRVRQ